MPVSLHAVKLNKAFWRSFVRFGLNMGYMIKIRNFLIQTPLFCILVNENHNSSFHLAYVHNCSTVPPPPPPTYYCNQPPQ